MSLNSLKNLIEVIGEQPMRSCRAGYEICKEELGFCVMFKLDEGLWKLEKILSEPTFSVKAPPTLRLYTVKSLSNALNKKIKKIGFNTLKEF